MGGNAGFDLYSIDGRIAVDRVCRFEDLDAEIESVAKHLGLPALPKLIHAKSEFRTDRRHYRELLTDSDRRWIESAFAREIAHFGYEF